MNAMDGSSSNGWNVITILRLGGGKAKVIHIHLEELGGRPCLTPQWYVHYCHGFFNGIMQEDNLVINVMLCDVSGRLRHRAKNGTGSGLTPFELPLEPQPDMAPPASWGRT